MCFFLFSGSALLYKTNNLEKYRTLWQDTSLTCEEVSITNATTYFTFKKNGTSFIVDGIVSQPTKHKITINVGVLY